MRVIIFLLLALNAFGQFGDPSNGGIMLNQMAEAPDSNYMILTKPYNGISGIQHYVKFDSVMRCEVKYFKAENVKGSSVTVDFDLPADSTADVNLEVRTGGIVRKRNGKKGYTITPPRTINFPFARHVDVEVLYNKKLFKK